MRGGCLVPPSSTFPQAPPVIPDGRISRVRLATMTIPARPSQWGGGSSARSRTPHHTVCHTARQSAAVVHQTQALRPVMVPVSDRHGREPLPPAEVLPRRRTMPGTLGSMTHPSSLLRAHAPDQDPPPSLGCPSVRGSVQVVASPSPVSSNGTESWEVPDKGSDV